MEGVEQKSSNSAQVKTNQSGSRPNSSYPNNYASNNREGGGNYKKQDKDYPAGDNSYKRRRTFFGKRVSFFVKNPDIPIDYKRVDILVKFISNKGKIIPRKFTGLSALHQRKVAKEVKRARHAGLLPYSYK